MLVCILAGGEAWLFRNRKSNPQPASTPKDQECIEKAKRGDCDFYTCFDMRHNCDYHNYALNYGLRFCTRFDERRAQFNQRAWDWINNTRVCTMQKMLPDYESEVIHCEDVEHTAKHAHSDCSAAHGLCDVDMIWQHKDIMVDVYKPSRRAAVRFLMGIKSCGLHHARRLLAWVARTMVMILLPFLNNN
eukprot:GHVU01152914.1.p1 GENE.GHVU01152914.1~~GHVU01152914.1.p1  ORF type:complete len:189 (+),score=21.89 GHVU01152914.1:37-603(+)